MSEYRMIRLSGMFGEHLIISRACEEYPTGHDASCPTGNTVEELRECLNEMLEATQKDIIERPAPTTDSPEN